MALKGRLGEEPLRGGDAPDVLSFMKNHIQGGRHRLALIRETSLVQLKRDENMVIYELKDGVYGENSVVNPRLPKSCWPEKRKGSRPDITLEVLLVL